MRTDWSRLILDLDGTLVDFAARHYQCFLQSAGCNTMPSPELSLETYWVEKRAGRSGTDLLQRLPHTVNPDAFKTRWAALIESPQMLDLDTLLPGASRLLAVCIQEKKEVILATRRRSQPGLENQLQRLGIADHFSKVIQCSAESGGKGKAKAVMEWLTPENLASGTLWVGDSEDDFEGAKALGCAVLLVSTGIRGKEYLGKLAPGSVIDSLDEITTRTP